MGGGSQLEEGAPVCRRREWSVSERFDGSSEGAENCEGQERKCTQDRKRSSEGVSESSASGRGSVHPCNRFPGLAIGTYVC